MIGETVHVMIKNTPIDFRSTVVKAHLDGTNMALLDNNELSNKEVLLEERRQPV